MTCFKHCRYCAVENCAMRITDEVICDHYKQKQQTRADLIRAMTDEELAEYLSNIDDMSCAADDNWKCRTPASCKDCILEWLKQEVTDDNA